MPTPSNGHVATFTTRPSWDDYGDLEIDGEVLGWHSKADAIAEAAKLTTELIIIKEDDFAPHPRRK